MPKRPRDLSGQRFGLLTVLGKDGDRNREPYWRCLCDCGGEKRTLHRSLIKGETRSCGCTSRQWIGAARTTHGHTRRGQLTPEYRSWMSMLARCERPSHKSYARYGGRGIKVCARWQSFQNFLADMGPKPPGLTLERKDNDGGYEPGNCLWASQRAQARNRRSTRLICCFGKRQPLVAWAAETGIHRQTITSRLKRGWSVNDALCAPAERSAT